MAEVDAVPPTPPPGTLVGGTIEVARVEPGEASCWVERACAEAQSTCETRETIDLGCGPAACREMAEGRECRDSSRCYESMSCVYAEPTPLFRSRGSAYPQCRPTPCQSDGDCRSGNLECVGGTCAHRECRRSRDCPGYCVGGVCRAEPGRCVARGELARP